MLSTALSLILFATGAVMAFAVKSDPSGVDLQAAGVIVMLVSAVAFALAVSRKFWSDQVYEMRVEQGTAPPPPVDSNVLVDPDAPLEGDTRTTGEPWRHDPATDAWRRGGHSAPTG